MAITDQLKALYVKLGGDINTSASNIEEWIDKIEDVAGPSSGGESEKDSYEPFVLEVTTSSNDNELSNLVVSDFDYDALLLCVSKRLPIYIYCVFHTGMHMMFPATYAAQEIEGHSGISLYATSIMLLSPTGEGTDYNSMSVFNISIIITDGIVSSVQAGTYNATA